MIERGEVLIYLIRLDRFARFKVGTSADTIPLINQTVEAMLDLIIIKCLFYLQQATGLDCPQFSAVKKPPVGVTTIA